MFLNQAFFRDVGIDLFRRKRERAQVHRLSGTPSYLLFLTVATTITSGLN